MKQVITVSPEGEVSGLQRRRGQGIDLRQFGRAEIERVSEVLWHVQRQAWYVLGKAGPAAGRILTMTDADDLGVAFGAAAELSAGGMLLFQEYEDAVSAEVAWLDALRVRGDF